MTLNLRSSRALGGRRTARFPYVIHCFAAYSLLSLVMLSRVILSLMMLSRLRMFILHISQYRC